MGSIPTHSRHLLAGALALGLLAAGRPAAAQMVPAEPEEPPPAVTAPGPVPEEGIVPSPFNRALRSAFVPGWGQLTNGKPKKTVVQFGVQTYLLTRIVIETRAAGQKGRAADALRGMDGQEAEIARLEDKQQDHYKRRRDLFFWWIIAAFYGAMDAYVDAHLGDFERDLEDGRTLFGGVDPVSRNVELGLRF